MTEDPIRGAYRVTPKCLSEDDLAVAAESRDLPQTEKAHIESCPRCKAEIALLRSFLDAEASPAERDHASWVASTVERRLIDTNSDRKSGVWKTFFAFTSFPRWSLVAALSLLVVVTATYRIQNTGNNLPKNEATETYRSGVVGLVAPHGEVTQSPRTFSWSGYPDAVRYEISVMEVDKNVLWKTTTDKTNITAPADLSAKALPGKTLLWQVAALDSKGTLIASSEIWRFRKTVQ